MRHLDAEIIVEPLRGGVKWWNKLSLYGLRQGAILAFTPNLSLVNKLV